MPSYRIRHITRYTYTSPVIDSANQILLYPIIDQNQEVKNHELVISHNPTVEIYNDYFGNRLGLFTIIKPHSELSIHSEMEVVTTAMDFPFSTLPPDQQWQQIDPLSEQPQFMDFLNQETFSNQAEVQQEVKLLKEPSIGPLELAIRMSTFIYDHFEYKKGITSVETGIDEVWNLKAGVCQDFAHILIVMLRMVNIPARYVSGYICPKNHDMRGEGATHAWVDAYLPDNGWVGLDPTNNTIVSDRHVRLAVGRSFSDCTPVKGTYKGPVEHTLEVLVTIENGTPRAPSDMPEMMPYTYHVQSKTPEMNSYRRFQEMQQMQQQQ